MKRFLPAAAAVILAVFLAGCSFSEELISAVMEQLESYLTEPAEPTEPQTPDLPLVPTEPEPEKKDGVTLWWRDEPYTDAYDELAAGYIDENIRLALNAVAELRHDELIEAASEKKDTPFSEDLREYNGFSEKQKALFDLLQKTGREYETVKLTEEEYGASLVTDFLTVETPFSMMDPLLKCCFTADFGWKDITTQFYDPDGDMNDVVEPGTEAFEKMKGKIELLKAILRRVVRKMPEDWPTYDKYYYLGTVVATRAKYNCDFKAVPNCTTAYGCLVGGECLCEGYSDAFFLLCKEADLSCELLSGMANDTGHMWNVVEIGGAKYHFDTTWAGEHRPGSIDFDELLGMTNEECEASGHVFDAACIASGAPLW